MPTATDDGRGLHLRLTLSSGSTVSSAGGPTSFKRSLEELFGGAESDGEGERSRSSTGGGGGMAVGGGGVGNGGGGGSSNGRNKRPRSESAEQPLRDSASSSSSSAANGRGLSLPPRLPTPRLDVHMSDIPLLDPNEGLEFSSPQRRRQQHQQQTSSSRSLPSPLPSTSASTSTSPQSSIFATTQQANLTLSAIHNTITSAHATTTAISTLGLGPSSISTSPSPVSSSSLPLPSASSSSSAPSSQSRSDRSSSPSLILPLPLSRSVQAPPTTTSIAGNLPLPSPTTATGIVTGTGTNINEAEASPSAATASGVADLLGPEERFRATMQRYNVFENEIAALRRSVSPPGSSRDLTVVGMGGQQHQQQQQTASPPRLPPLELSSLRDEGDDVDEEEEEDRVRPLGSVRHGHVTSASLAASSSSERSSTSPALHLPNRSSQRNHLEPFSALPAAAGVSPLPFDEDVDELEDDEDMSNHQHHQHQRISPPLLVHGRSNRPVRAAVGDAPPRIELSNAVWSSLDIGSDATPSTSARGVTTTMMTTNHDRVVVDPLDVAEENDDDENDAPEDDHDNNVYPRFRDHLDSALEALRSPSSPLVPGLVPSSIESSNTLTPIPNNDDEPPTTLTLNDSEGHHPSSPISLSPPPVIPSTLSSSSLAFSNNVGAPLRESQSQGVSNPTSSSSLSGAVPAGNANMVRRFGRPPTLPPILTEPTNLRSSSSSSGRVDGRYISHRLMMPSSSSSASSRERDEQSTRIRRRISIDDDNNHNEVDIQAPTNSRGTLQRSSNLGEVELPSPSLSEFYDWLGSPNSPDPDLLRDVVVVPMANEANSVGRSSGPSREETRAATETETAERDSELERRRSWEEDVLSGFVDTDLGLDLNLRQRERDQQQQQQQQISLPPPLPPFLAVRPTLERRLSQVDSGVVDMDVDMESFDDLDSRQRELELERLPWTLGSSISSSTVRANQLSPRLDLDRELRRLTASSPTSRSTEISRLYNDTEADDGWNPLHSTRHWHSESTPAASTSSSISSLPTFSSSLFSSVSSPPLITPQSTAVHPHPHPPSTAAALSSQRPRLPDFLLPRSSSHRGGRSHLPPFARHSSSNVSTGVGRERERERRSSGESNDSLPPSLELNLGPSSHSVFGTSAGGDPRASGTASEEVPSQHEHSLTSTPSSSSSSLTPFMRLFEPPTAVPPPSLGQQVPLLSSQQDHHHQNQSQRNPIEIEILDDDDDDDDVDDVVDVILNDGLERQPLEQLHHLLQDEDRERQQQRRRRQEQEREREQQHRYRPHTRIVGSDNSLVAENATETRRLYARMDVARRLHHSSSNVSRRSSERSWASIVEEEERSRNVGDDEDLRSNAYRDEEGGLEESGGVGETSERQRRVRALATQIQHQRRQRSDASGRQGRYEDSLSRRFTRHFPDSLDGIGMPPRVTNSGGGGSTSNSNDRVPGPRIIPPPPRPRLHSIRHVPTPTENTGSGNGQGDDDNGYGSSMPRSQVGDNRNNDASPSTTVTNAPPHQMSSEEEWGTMFQLRSPGNHVDPGTITSATQRPFITDSAARPSLDSVSSSDSSMTDSFTSSGASSSSVSGSNVLPLRALNRGMFLDTELPSPGLGGLFDTLVTNSTATTAPHTTTVPHPARSFTANSSPAPSSVIVTAPTSEHYSSNSSSGFLSSTTGRFTPSPVRTSDGDLDEERVVADETARLHSLATRLGSMRDEMVSEMMNWWERPEGSESEMRMNVDEGEQRGRAQNVHRAPITHRSSAGDFRRPVPFSPPSSTVAASNTPTAGLTSPSSPSANASSNSNRERRNHVIDPTLFAPGLFRNTVENFARTREYTAQTSASVPSPSSVAAASRPTPAPAMSISSPTMSSGFAPPQPTTSLSSPATYRFAPEQPLRNTLVPRQPPHHHHHHHHHHRHGISGGTQSPPVIPPLSFEDDSSETAAAATAAGARTRERSDVQEPLDSVVNEDEQMRQGYFSLLRRQRRDSVARRVGETSIGEGERPSNARVSTSAAPPNFLSSSSPSSSSSSTPFERRSWSWSQLERLLERSPERFEYHTSPGSSSRAVENRFRGNMEAIRPAIERQRRMRQEAVDEQRRIAERHWDVLRWRNDNNNNNNPRPSLHNSGSSGDTLTRNRATTNLPNTSGANPDSIYSRVRLARETSTQNDSGTTTTAATTTGSDNNDSGHARFQHRRWYDVIHGNLRNVLPEEQYEEDSEDELDFETFPSQRQYRDPPLPNFGPRMPLPRLESRLQGAIERERENSTTRHRPRPNPGYVSWIPPQGYERVGPRPRNVAVGGGQDTSGASVSGSGGVSTAARAVNDFSRPSRLRERTIHRLRASAVANANNGPGGNGVSGMRFGRLGRRFGDLGDYMNDDEFDTSYESLLSLQETLGDVRPRSTPEAVLKKLKTGKYKEWVEQGGEIRCPICLEDYDSEDDLLKSGNCKHWMHKACLEQWFKAANTCPVCRTEVEPRSHSRIRCRRPIVLPRRNPGGGNGGGSGNGDGSGNGSGSGNRNGGGSAGDPGADPSSDPSGSGPNGNNNGTSPRSNSSGRGGAFDGGEFW